jgi:predicted Zn-dependent protease
MENLIPAVTLTPALMLSPELAQMLTEIGFLAIERGRRKEALGIFKALQRFRPDKSYPVLGLAMLALAEKKDNDALVMLQNAAERHPDDNEVKALLGLTLLLLNKIDEARALAAELVLNDGHEAPHRFAQALNNELQHRSGPASPTWAQGNAPATAIKAIPVSGFASDEKNHVEGLVDISDIAIAETVIKARTDLYGASSAGRGIDTDVSIEISHRG